MTLSQASFDYIRDLLRQRSAHHLDDDKGYLVETRLLVVARRYGFGSAEELLLHLRGRRNELLLAEVVEAMAISETSFFRDGHPWEALRQAVLPELIRLRTPSRTLNIWSAACSTGQEAYSLTILLDRHFPELAHWSVRLIASDLSTAVLQRARRGHYSELEVSRGLPAELLTSYFDRAEDGWQIRDDLRRRVDFLRINLSDPWPMLPPLDLVLLRNVLIYFDLPTRRRVLSEVLRVLRPDGYLLLGGAETTRHLMDDFDTVSFGPSSLHRTRPGRPSSSG